VVLFDNQNNAEENKMGRPVKIEVSLETDDLFSPSKKPLYRARIIESDYGTAEFNERDDRWGETPEIAFAIAMKQIRDWEEVERKSHEETMQSIIESYEKRRKK
jgi:hypothetical protein